MGFGLLVVLVFWGLLIAGAVWLARAVFTGNIWPKGVTGKGGSSPREILDQRYARGEIGVKEYEQILQDIGR